MYVDDVIVFCRGTVKNAKELMVLFAKREDSFGQIISRKKSIFLLSWTSTKDRFHPSLMVLGRHGNGVG